ncbi:elongator protein 2 [Arabidopsis thaliana]|uniref:Elongator complex protein 2 n=1 Tax=Arabidopsis thaliana TaxID=3702 RepID=ELP2_ARATH|nr:elongator protein 2 [Arabidopsis thaliana]F4I1S7.1 RecName: Full=Elongator complex protein 2; Short=AtELP2; AltName: Full=Elongator component 2; AltName: Full=Protein GREEN NPR1 SEEDLING ON SA MEDIUM 1 [Arabidopsis thaliana]AEE32440.1 elongator protein 2 [Arabidopsis thaliana]|eukprot:NP_175377.2 elongator protein 2 [Arabidopsis thaliana]
MSENTKVEAKRVFIGAGCNRVVNNVSWGASGLVSFGAQNAVAVFCPKTAQILTTLPGHKASVNCTHWLPTSKFAFKAKKLDRQYLLSGDSDGIIILWELSTLNNDWRHVLQLPLSHKKGVTCITAYMVSETDAMFASASSDGVVNVWDVSFPSQPSEECKVVCLDSICVDTKAIVTLSLAELPQNPGRFALALGGLDNKIKLYSGERTGKFTSVCELKGHTDWIRSLDFSLPLHTTEEIPNSIMLVSSSQDKVIRIWKLVLVGDVGSWRREITLASYIEGPVFVSGTFTYQISVESVLIGHEDWVYSVEWQPPVIDFIDGRLVNHQPLSILSASMDKTMMIWRPEKKTGVWVNVVCVGELSHCALGFYGGHWSPNSLSILAHGYGGAFHLWRNVSSSKESENWQMQKVPSGHFAAVTDVTWARTGEYLLSVSQDQTTRVFSAWKNDEGNEAEDEHWHELARPQVHGHDINCVAMVQGKGNHRFVSGAEEKVVRVFEAPLSFLKTLNHTCAGGEGSFPEDLQADVQVLGANMSALGLSQKPIYLHSSSEPLERNGGGEGLDTFETVPEAAPAELKEPPIEDQLAFHTLWPESHKLYGHGNELFSLCSDHKGNLVASSCKAQSASMAEIWLWEVGTWKAVGRLQSHSLTVTHLEFSYDDTLLLSVSRDRHFSVFSIQRTDNGEVSHKLMAKVEAHKRIIWACSWNPFGHQFATSSRDKTVKIWSVENDARIKQILVLPPFGSSVTAVAWTGLDRNEKSGCVAVGMESGLIELSNVKIIETEEGTTATAALALRLEPFMCHVSAVNRLAWRPTEKCESNQSLRWLTSCGDDNCVRVFNFKF